jgi:hypothetical protein
MKIEINKRYMLRDGKITQPLKLSNNGTKYIFESKLFCPIDEKYFVASWLISGRYLSQFESHHLDIFEKVYTVFDIYEKIEKLKDDEKLNIQFDELSIKVFKPLDQSYFLESVKDEFNYLFRFNEKFNKYVCINTINKIKVTI